MNSSKEKDIVIGRLIGAYRSALEEALKNAKKLTEFGVERPWVIRSDAGTDSNNYYFKGDVPRPDPVISGQRIRLEVR